jgi:hypothetical protein
MVEVTVWTVVACQSKGGGDADRQASGAGPALVCRAGELVGRAQPEEREGGAPVLETRGARGGSSAWRPTEGRRKGEEKKEGKRKRRKEKKKKEKREERK